MSPAITRAATPAPAAGGRAWRGLRLLGCALPLLLVAGVARAQEPAVPADTAAAAKPIPAEQLQALVAPIALYPDELLAQTLVASTYPLEIVQLQQWLVKHPELKDKALADSVAKQPWDPSIKSMAAFPEVVKRLADDIQWATDLGNAFLAQQSAVMDAVQVMRGKAKDKGALVSDDKQKVETKTEAGKTVIVVEPAQPEVIYVPSYTPSVVYGPPPMYYPYPPIYYPPYPPGGAFLSFSFGVMWGAAIWGGSCCHAGWGGNDIYINHNNNFNKIEHYGGGQGGGNNWQHNPGHRGGAPYPDQRTSSKYGGGNRGGSRGASAGTMPTNVGAGQRGAGVSDRAAGGAGQRGAGVSDRAGGAGGAGGREQIGNRSIPSSSSRSGGFSGGGGDFNGSTARANSARGGSSMSRGGGGFSRGGGGGRRR